MYVCVLCLQIAAPGGEEYSQIQCDKIPPNRHDIQVDDSSVNLYFTDYIYVCECVCMYIYTYVSVCICMYICECVYIYVCKCVCVCIYIYICECVYMYIYM